MQTTKQKLDKQLIVLTTQQDHEFIKTVAEQNHISMGDVIRNLINEYKNKQEQDLNQMALF
jgi:hypothetical protein